MNTEYFGSHTNESVTETSETLSEYREYVRSIISNTDLTVPESALVAWSDEKTIDAVHRVRDQLGTIKHLVLIGIGGSSLGTEAIHSLLSGPVTLHVLDSVAPYRIEEVVHALRDVSPKDLAICLVSKSGGTTETLTNASVFIEELQKELGKPLYARTVCIGDANNNLLQTAEKLGMIPLPMLGAVGGRYSVFTAVGLLPLALLGHNIDEILRGLCSATSKQYEEQALLGAKTLFVELQNGARSLNLFAFDTRLQNVARWYRQLIAESIGKELKENGEQNDLGFVPTISTPVELHSMGQLYFSGFAGVYTDILTLTNDSLDFVVDVHSKTSEGTAGRSMQEIQSAIFEGVIGAYKERHLAYRTTVLSADLPYELGLFMGVRMLEVMYLAKLMQVDAFTQPNVELYKNITRDILDT